MVMKLGGFGKEKRPVIQLSNSPLDWLGEFLALLGILLMVGAIARYYPQLPATIPTHFNAAGEIDGWGGKHTLFMMPALGIFLLYLPMTILQRFPHIYNYMWPITEENARVQYQMARTFMIWLKVETVWLFTLISWETIQLALKNYTEPRINYYIWPILALITLTIALYMYVGNKAR